VGAAADGLDKFLSPTKGQRIDNFFLRIEEGFGRTSRNTPGISLIQLV
jgi:hypothetical protein